jgi:hypothetical protein
MRSSSKLETCNNIIIRVRNMPSYFAIFNLFAVFQNFNSVAGHGRLLEPVSRASAWRKGYSSPPDYSDSQGFCGGFAVSSFQSFSY